MITATLRGQLANQMFICATAIAHAQKLNTTYAFPDRSGRRDQFPFLLDWLPTMRFKAEYNNVREVFFGKYQDLPNEPDLNLQGYWQNYKYFDHIKEELRSLFKIQSFDTYMGDYISIHIRRGDSLKFTGKLPQPTDKYIQEAISNFPRYSRFAIFSDDMVYSMGYFTNKRFPGCQFNFVEPDFKNPLGDLGMMASCKANIIVNSTFSWMAAYFGKGNVICPSEKSWFTPAYADRLSAEGLMYPGWTKIDY